MEPNLTNELLEKLISAVLNKGERCKKTSEGIFIVDVDGTERRYAVEMLVERLVNKINQAANTYYNSGSEIISNKEYDDLFDILSQLEKSGMEIKNSPTHKVGAEVVESLQKVKHEFPAKSLDKTKDVDLMCKKFSEGVANAWNEHRYSYNVCVMWKCDGSTIVATYDKGQLIQVATRGNGEVGQDITHNAPYIKGLPQTITYKGKIIVRGEALMTYNEFERINSLLGEDSLYKNPRNLANATISMLDSNEMKKRSIEFKAFEWVYSEDILPSIFSLRLQGLSYLGFSVVPYETVPVDHLKETLKEWTNRVEKCPFPVDGLVICMEDYAAASKLPGTEHNPNQMAGYALKWADETVESVLQDIEWSASRTGLLNPVAVFTPVELEGTTVSRASLHNVSYIMDKNLHIGDRVTVYKANKIIPQIENNLDADKYAPVSFTDAINFGPEKCPVCGGEVDYVLGNDNTVTVKCSNVLCPAKQIGKIVHMCERDCLNIVGLSEEKITYLINHGYINNRYDLFVQARKYKEGCGILNAAGKNLEEQDGWGKQSVKNLADAIFKATDTDFVSFIHAMGIENVGKGQAKSLKNYLDTNYDELVEKYHSHHDGSYDLLGLLAGMVQGGFDLTAIEGIGKVIADSLVGWIQFWLIEPPEYILEIEETKADYEVLNILEELHFQDKPVTKEVNSSIAGKTFVITGSLNHYANRDELVRVIESLGGKVSGSVSSKTDYLINNDLESTSGKNKKAQELGIKIINEEIFRSWL